MEALIAEDTAGSPVDENIRWTNRSVPELAEELQDQGFEISPDALRRILFEELGLSRRQAFKDEAACTFEHRDEQFRYIAELRQYFASLPVDRFPHVVAMAVPLTSEVEPDARFEFGLDALVRGMETMKGAD